MPRLSLATKLNIIKDFSNSVNQVDLAESYSVNQSTISRVLSQSDELIQKTSVFDTKRKRLTPRPFESIEKEVDEWMTHANNLNIPLNVKLVQKYAREIANDPQFKASNGWYEKFRKATNQSSKRICGEEKSVDVEACDEWIKKLPDLLNGYQADCIYNVDETGLFINQTPTRTISKEGLKASISKH